MAIVGIYSWLELFFIVFNYIACYTWLNTSFKLFQANLSKNKVSNKTFINQSTIIPFKVFTSLPLYPNSVLYEKAY